MRGDLVVEAKLGRYALPPVKTVLSHEPADSKWSGPRGLVTAALCPALGIDFKQTAAFICGNLGMVEAVERMLIELGVQPDWIHAEKFVPSGTPEVPSPLTPSPLTGIYAAPPLRESSPARGREDFA